MTELSYMDQQLKKHQAAIVREFERGVPKEVADNMQAKISHFQSATVALRMPTYTRHEVAEILAELFGDTCACNFNGNDEWLPEKCELLDACPNTVGVACWEQYLKFRDAKMDGDGDG